MRIVIASDHGGFPLKEELRGYLAELGHEAVDFGTHGPEPVDYPDFAFLVAAAVSTGEYPFGVMIDGAGIGSAIVANKLPGVRAALCNDLYAANNAREHNHANVLTMGARVVGSGLAREILRVFLATQAHPRHQGRIDKIGKLERQLYRQAGA